MPTFVVKPDQDQDFYVMWSTIVDNATGWGSRADLLRSPRHRNDLTPERFDRADQYGTSMCDPTLPPDQQWYGWRDRDWLVTNIGAGFYRLARENARAYCEALAQSEDKALEYLTPEDDE